MEDIRKSYGKKVNLIRESLATKVTNLRQEQEKTMEGSKKELLS